MKVIRTSFIVMPLVAAIAIGCGGGGGGGSETNGGQTAEELVRSGTEKLDAMLADTSPVNATTLAAAMQDFQQARTLDGNNTRANGGYAMLSIAYDAQRIIDLFHIETSRSTGDTGLLERRLSSARFGFLSSPMLDVRTEDALPIGTDGNLRLVGMLSGGVTSSREYPVNPTYQQAYDLLTSVDANMATVQAVLENSQRLPTDESPMSIVDPRTPSHKVKIGTVEMKALLMAVRGLRSVLAVALSYNLGFDVNVYPYDDPFYQAFSTYLGGTAMPGNAYLPSGNFGKLHGDGGSRMAAFRSQATGAIDVSFATLDVYKVRTGSGWVIEPGQITAAEENDYRSNAAKVKRALNEIYEIESGVMTNVPAFCSNPPSNIVALAPTLHVTHYNSQAHDGTIHHTGQDYPDRTFGGLFTSPIPASRLGGTVDFYADDTIVSILTK